MSELLFMEPYFKDVIWGGSKMKDKYDYPIPTDTTGEAWVISGNANGKSVVKNGSLKGMTLAEVFAQHPELFNSPKEKQFPLLVKIIDANDNLSVQVHPDDVYASANENGSKGKTECWYILDCDPDAEIIVGHNAKSEEELNTMIDEGKWEELLNRFPIKKGDFFYIPAGTVHAIQKGTVILEIQQNSDVTYRLYDYGRLQDGKPRELHLDKSKDVITVPAKAADSAGEWVTIENGRTKNLASTEFFTVDIYEINGKLDIEQNFDYLLVDIAEGNGTVDGTPVKAGDHFIAPYGYGTLPFDGDMTIVCSHV